MGPFLAPLAVVTAFATLASAGIQITSPKAGTTLTAGQSIVVEWDDKGSGTAIADLTTFNAFLIAGPNDQAFAGVVSYPITTSGDFSKGGNSASGLIPTTIGGNTPSNAYYIKIVASAKDGGTYTAFSDRFSYKGMTGSFSTTLTTALKAVSGTTGPTDIDGTADNSNNAAASNPADSEYEVEYTMQTGPTRYAPMQPVPGTKITAKSAKMQYPTSSVAIATSKLPIPSIQTTITQSQTHKVSSMANTVAAAPMPSDDMAKFLRRWQD